MIERELRERMAMHGQSLFDRGYTCGSTGNISVRLGDHFLITPTNSCLGRLDPEEIAKVDANGSLISGKPPSKECFLHLAYYSARPNEQAIVHLHSTWSVAVSCLSDVNPDDVLPAITAYYVMRVGQLPLVEYFAPGDKQLAEAVKSKANHAKSLLLANHGPVVGGSHLDAAVYNTEELEETARLFLMLRGLPTRYLSDVQQTELRQRFPN